MKKMIYLLAVLVSLHSFATSLSSNLEFSKQVFKIKATIKKVDGNFVLIPDSKKDQQFVPQYLPDEYKINGLKVTFDGDVANISGTQLPLNIRKIWVEYELKEKYKLAHKMYDLN